MNLGSFSYFEAINTRMHWLNQRQRLLAENVANANTPGFRSKDLAEPNFQALLAKNTARIGMATTASNHVGGTEQQGKTKFKVQESDEIGDKSGNSVVLEREMLKVSQTTADHELMSNLYKKGMAMLRIAISRPARG